MENRELLERIVALMPIASKDITRTHINGVYIRSNSERRNIVLEVTDGHRAIREHLKHSFLPELLDKGYLIDREYLGIIKQALKNAGKYSELKLRIENERLIIDEEGYYVPLYTVNYPNLDQVWPKQEGKIRIGVNAQYIIELAKALNDDNKDKNIAIIADVDENGKTTKPLFVKAKCGKEAILMPVRV